MTTHVARLPTTPVITCDADNTCDEDDDVDDAKRHCLGQTAVPGAQVGLKVLSHGERRVVVHGVAPRTLVGATHVATFN